MHALFRRSETRRNEQLLQQPEPPANPRRLWQTAPFFAAMILFLGFSDWYNTNDVTIALKHGTRVEAILRYSRPDALDLQEYDDSGRLGTELRRLDRAAIETVTLKPAPAGLK